MTMTQRPMNAPMEGRTDNQLNSDSQVEGIERIQPLIGKWVGGMASLWTYSISHAKLIIRLTRPTLRGNLHISCFGCGRISAPTNWGGVNLQLSAEDGPEGRRYVIRDEANKVEIRCGFLTAQENVEPIY